MTTRLDKLSGGMRALGDATGRTVDALNWLDGEPEADDVRQAAQALDIAMERLAAAREREMAKVTESV